MARKHCNNADCFPQMVEPTEPAEEEMVFECSSCSFVQSEENMSYSDNTCPHCGSTMYTNR